MAVGISEMDSASVGVAPLIFPVSSTFRLLPRLAAQRPRCRAAQQHRVREARCCGGVGLCVCVSAKNKCAALQHVSSSPDASCSCFSKAERWTAAASSIFLEAAEAEAKAASAAAARDSAAASLELRACTSWAAVEENALQG
jgi:hypothetical protein